MLNNKLNEIETLLDYFKSFSFSFKQLITFILIYSLINIFRSQFLKIVSIFNINII